MPTGSNRPRNRFDQFKEEEYRRRQEVLAVRRKKRRIRQLVVIIAFVVALALLVLCAVMIVRAVKTPAGNTPVVPVTSGDISDTSASDGQGEGSRPTAVDTTAWNLILINNNNPMAEGFEPETVMIDNVGHMFDTRAAEKLTRMIEACNAVEGQSLAVASAYRGPKTQDGKYDDLAAAFAAEGMSTQEADTEARKIDPPYGYSDHQSGLAVDFVNADSAVAAGNFSETAEAAWLRVNAADYGFILRFPQNKEAITGITFQPYHYRHVGVEEAKAISEAGICLEEYLA